jgi:hypothetical protein
MRVAFLEPTNYYELNPAEENRTYSSSHTATWEQSMLDSTHGWHENIGNGDAEEWMTIDAGEEVLIAGVIF